MQGSEEEGLCAPKLGGGEISPLDWMAEFRRQGVVDNPLWRISHVNKGYDFLLISTIHAGVSGRRGSGGKEGWMGPLAIRGPAHLLFNKSFISSIIPEDWACG